MGALGCANTFDSDTTDNVNIIKKHRIDLSIIFPLRANIVWTDLPDSEKGERYFCITQLTNQSYKVDNFFYKNDHWCPVVENINTVYG